jgi:hypothetical protein
MAVCFRCVKRTLRCFGFIDFVEFLGFSQVGCIPCTKNDNRYDNKVTVTIWIIAYGGMLSVCKTHPAMM